MECQCTDQDCEDEAEEEVTMNEDGKRELVVALIVKNVGGRHACARKGRGYHWGDYAAISLAHQISNIEVGGGVSDQWFKIIRSFLSYLLMFADLIGLSCVK